MESVCKKWTDERGKRVTIVPFLRESYSDEISSKLTLEYNIHTCPQYQVPSSLGETEAELFALRLLCACSALGEFVGFRREELDKLARAYQETGNPSDLLSRGLLRKKLIRGIEVLFPTEELLKTQGVKPKERI
jgi:hypothetical protein